MDVNTVHEAGDEEEGDAGAAAVVELDDVAR
jgi:hypothetical protein